MKFLPHLVAVAIGVSSLASSAASAAVLPADRMELGRGVMLVVQGNFTAAEPILKKALAMNNELAEGHYNLGVVYRATGRPREAIGEYREALLRYRPEEESNRAKCLYGMALAGDATGDPQLAARHWQDYITFAEHNPREHDVLLIARTHLVEQQRLAGIRRPGI